MKIYPILSSDLYALSCVPVSMLDRMGDTEISAHLAAGGSLKFLVAQYAFKRIQTDTGYVSKHIEYADLSTVLADDFDLYTLQTGVYSLSDYVRKNDLQNISVVIDAFPRPYIISAFQLSNGYITGLSGYALSDALTAVVPTLQYTAISALSVYTSMLKAPEIDDISARIPAAATAENQLADKQYVSAEIQTNASFFRGTFENWASVPDNPDGDYSEDSYGRKTPTQNDYMIVYDVADYPAGDWPFDDGDDDEDIDTINEKKGTWRFSYRGAWHGKAGWRPEYRIEKYNFSDSQINAINSGVTSGNFVKRSGRSVGTDYKGIWLENDGTIHSMMFELRKDVPADAALTDHIYSAAPGGGIQIDNIAGDMYNVSLAPAARNTIGGMRVGKGLFTHEGSGRVDAATAVKIVDVAQGDAPIPEELSSAFGDEIHVGAIMIVRQGYDLAQSASYTGYIYTGEAWEAMAGNCRADNVILPDDIELAGEWTSVGNIEYSSGGVFACGGKSVAEAFRMIFGNGNRRSRIAYPAIEVTSFVYNPLSTYSPLPEDRDSRIIVDGDSTAGTAGSWNFTMSVPSECEWFDGTAEPKSVAWKITPFPVYLPELQLQDSGEEQGPNFDTEIYDVTGASSGSSVGEYECTLTLRDSVNYVWGDGTSGASRVVTWTIV